MWERQVLKTVKIVDVNKNSRAEKIGIKPGDLLVSINGNEITDVLDYRFYLADRTVTVAFLRDQSLCEVTIHKDEYDDIGLEFETPLMDKKHSCRNKCIFCFIDQLPSGMRESLYFKDDDSRLSFLHGNYITLTNLYDKDIERIIKMHISPVNVSVHTTNPELRVQMMKNKRAGEVLSYLDRFAEAGIKICAQIVLCKGVNDKAELERSMNDLCRLFPSLSSVSVVPAGLTKFRDNLFHLEAFTKEECQEVIEQVNSFGNKCLEKYGTRLFFCADEFYVRGEVEIPPDEYYEDYAQIENGVGMLRSLEFEFESELKFIDNADIKNRISPDNKRHIAIATGVAAYSHIKALAMLAESRAPGLQVDVYKIINRFFGESITVAGLLTGKDIAEQLADQKLPNELILPAVTLRADGDLFLCGMTPAELSNKLGVNVSFARNDGVELINAILGFDVTAE